jgi:lysophospholipase L1-like esterase
MFGGFTMRSAFTKFGVALLSCVFVAGVYAANPGGGGGRAPANKLIVGDSIFALSGAIRNNLQSDLNETVNSAARSGCQMIGGNGICSARFAVPNQYANASKTGIRTVIFNGGGNDFLLDDPCSPLTVAACQQAIQAIEETISSLAARMRANGATKVIFLGYYNTTGAPELRAINEFDADLKARTYPAQGITYVETRPAFAGREAQLLNADGIHPNAQGSRVLTDLIKQKL